MSASRRRILSALATSLVAASGMVSAPACSNSPVEDAPYGCSGASRYEVFQSAVSSSVVPLCTDDTAVPPNAPASTGYYNTTPPITEGDAASGYPFPGSPDASSAALAECARICTGSTYVLPCCRSQWEPQTVVCYPSCP